MGLFTAIAIGAAVTAAAVGTVAATGGFGGGKTGGGGTKQAPGSGGGMSKLADKKGARTRAQMRPRTQSRITSPLGLGDEAKIAKKQLLGQ